MAAQLIAQATYDREQITTALTTAIAQLPAAATRLAAARRVLLKPNFVVPEPAERAATTHPDVYMALARWLRQQGKQVAIGDSPAFGSAAQAVRLHGVGDECRDLGVEVLTLRRPRPCAGVTDSRAYGDLTIAAELDDFDALINLPKLKVHQQLVFSGATKNLFGCVTGKRKFFRHNVCANNPVRFAEMLLANARAAAPVLNIGDGIVAMHVKGPRGGQPYPLGRLIVSDDPLEHDWLMCRLIGLAPRQTPLFAALPAAEQARLQAACEPLVEGLTAPADFVQSYRVDVSFKPWHLLRTMWRSWRFRAGA